MSLAILDKKNKARSASLECKSPARDGLAQGPVRRHTHQVSITVLKVDHDRLRQVPEINLVFIGPGVFMTIVITDFRSFFLSSTLIAFHSLWGNSGS